MNSAKRKVMVSHQSDLLTQDLVLSGVQKYCKFSDYGLSFDYPLIDYTHETGDISYPQWQVDELEQTNFSNKQYQTLITFLKKQLSNYERYLNKFKTRANSKDSKWVKDFFSESLKAVATIPYFVFERSLQKKLERDNISPDAIPSSLTDTTKASKVLEKLAKKFNNELTLKTPSASLQKELRKFCDTYGYLGMIYFKGEPWTILQAFEMLKSNEHKMEKNKTVVKNLHVKFASALLKLRTIKWEAMCKGCFLFRSYWKKYYEKDFPYEQLLSLRMSEVIGIAQGNHQSYKIKKRNKFYLEINEQGVMLSENYVVKKIKETRDIKILQGMVAYKGNISGIAKVVLTPNEGTKLKKGEILVTKMSTPDFLPVMRKASAFVTDIGGITSHAAIISREMRKPCIVGTEVATKIIKDGDHLDMDTTKGIVHINKKH